MRGLGRGDARIGVNRSTGVITRKRRSPARSLIDSAWIPI